MQFDFLSVLVVFCFKIVVVLLFIVRGSAVCLPTPPSWPEAQDYMNILNNILPRLRGFSPDPLG